MNIVSLLIVAAGALLLFLKRNTASVPAGMGNAIAPTTNAIGTSFAPTTAPAPTTIPFLPPIINVPNMPLAPAQPIAQPNSSTDSNPDWEEIERRTRAAEETGAPTVYPWDVDPCAFGYSYDSEGNRCR